MQYLIVSKWSRLSNLSKWGCELRDWGYYPCRNCLTLARVKHHFISLLLSSLYIYLFFILYKWRKNSRSIMASYPRPRPPQFSIVGGDTQSFVKLFYITTSSRGWYHWIPLFLLPFLCRLRISSSPLLFSIFNDILKDIDNMCSIFLCTSSKAS